ncbi:MAG: hypothetical protein HFE78_04010 [Clostridiales bacterium]|nr:hypothetical protein [Clostridiales bacterium]
MAKKNMDIYVSRGANDSGNFTEFTVEAKSEGKYKRQKLLRMLLLVAWVLLVLVLMFVIGGVFVFVGALLLATGTWFLYYITAPMALTEFRYSLLSGEMIFDKFLGGRKYVPDLLRIRVSEMTQIAPYEGEYKAQADAEDIKNRYEFCSSLKSSDIYFAVFTKNGEKSVVFFDATEKALKIMKFLNKEAIVMKQVYR